MDELNWQIKFENAIQQGSADLIPPIPLQTKRRICSCILIRWKSILLISVISLAGLHGLVFLFRCQVDFVISRAGIRSRSVAEAVLVS